MRGVLLIPKAGTRGVFCRIATGVVLGFGGTFFVSRGQSFERAASAVVGLRKRSRASRRRRTTNRMAWRRLIDGSENPPCENRQRMCDIEDVRLSSDGTGGTAAGELARSEGAASNLECRCDGSCSLLLRRRRRRGLNARCDASPSKRPSTASLVVSSFDNQSDSSQRVCSTPSILRHNMFHCFTAAASADIRTYWPLIITAQRKKQPAAAPVRTIRSGGGGGGGAREVHEKNRD